MDRQIIIVTRDDQLRSALQRVCSGQGCRVETADSVETALDIAKRMSVCLMIAEASLQDISNGVDLVKDVHGQNPALQCLMIVDEKSTDHLALMEKETWVRFVRKPISMLQFALDVVDAIKKSKEGE